MPRAKNNTKDKKDAGERTTLTVTLTAAEKKALKMYALEKETTVTALIHDWIHTVCKGAM